MNQTMTLEELLFGLADGIFYQGDVLTSEEGIRVTILNEHDIRVEYLDAEPQTWEMRACFPQRQPAGGKPAPVAGLDYDPSAPMCQDDYEYLTGSGQYSQAGK